LGWTTGTRAGATYIRIPQVAHRVVNLLPRYPNGDTSEIPEHVMTRSKRREQARS
jgi:hypothetical protein